MAGAEPQPAAGDQDWFAREFAAAAPALLAWARLRLPAAAGSRVDVDDLLQEVGCRAFAARRSFDPDRGSFRQWLFGFATRVLLEALRDLQRRPEAPVALWEHSGSREVAASITTITRHVARGELVQSFLQRIDQLDAGDRELLLYHGLENLPHAQVAALLASNEAAIRKRWQRLCERLRKDPVFAMLAAS